MAQASLMPAPADDDLVESSGQDERAGHAKADALRSCRGREEGPSSMASLATQHAILPTMMLSQRTTCRAETANPGRWYREERARAPQTARFPASSPPAQSSSAGAVRADPRRVASRASRSPAPIAVPLPRDRLSTSTYPLIMTSSLKHRRHST
jgi:hypothetical protein